GEDLSQRVKRGAIPVDEALQVAKQIAEALEEAHEKGIVHRDLKPANVKLTADGKVKVLDFGLAKAFAGDPMSQSGSHDLSQSPTLAGVAGTQAGIILGTAAYMSPEQARGKAVDRRADIWAFGVVLFEMLTGDRLFQGETVSDTLAAVLKTDPDWARLPADLPPAVLRLLKRCLERDPKQRLQAIGETRVAIDELRTQAIPAASATGSAPVASTSRAWRLPLVAGLGLLAAGFAVAYGLAAARNAPPARTLQASLLAPENTVLGDSCALSPDGRWLVFEAWDSKLGSRALWLRELDTGKARQLEQTEGGELPFWSPDGTRLGFFADGKLKKIDPRGGPAQDIAEAPNARGGAWGPDGRIVFAASFREGLSVVPAGGGAPQRLTTLDATRDEKSHRFPVFLPGGEALLFLSQSAEGGTRNDPSRIDVLDLASGKRTALVTANSSPLFAPPGELLFWRDGTLFAQRFDPDARAVSGEPTPVATAVAYNQNEQVLASVSAEGTLVYREGSYGALSRVLWVDRKGLGVEPISDRETQVALALAPDGQRLAISGHGIGQGGADIWIRDFTSHPASQDFAGGAVSRLTFEEGSESYPAWSGDGRFLYYSSDRKNDGVIFRRRADGSGAPEEIGTTQAGIWPHAASRDGRFLVIGGDGARTTRDILRFDLASKAITPLVETAFLDDDAVLSPDDRLLAYASEQSGRWEVYVQTVDGESGRWQVSSERGRRPRWRGDGRELFFLAPPDRIMSVDVTPGPTPRFSQPRELFRFPAESFDVAPDGQRFVVSSISEGSLGKPYTLVTGWQRRMEKP
ncbi:MAG: protein kinase, partial [Vicinamibacteria bacterium]|nr:protein kinase [Vicinamibacteria bacterium]